MTTVRVTNTPIQVIVTQDGGNRVVVEAPPIHVVTASAIGIQGPAGTNGSAGARYTHVQASALLIWTVAHNLGFRPNVTVTTTGGQEVWGGEVLHLSSNTLTITFDVALAGSADCV